MRGETRIPPFCCFPSNPLATLDLHVQLQTGTGHTAISFSPGALCLRSIRSHEAESGLDLSWSCISATAPPQPTGATIAVCCVAQAHSISPLPSRVFRHLIVFIYSYIIPLPTWYSSPGSCVFFRHSICRQCIACELSLLYHSDRVSDDFSCMCL